MPAVGKELMSGLMRYHMDRCGLVSPNGGGGTKDESKGFILHVTSCRVVGMINVQRSTEGSLKLINTLKTISHFSVPIVAIRDETDGY